MRTIQGKAPATTIIIVLLIAILLAVTNPQQESHIAAINNRLAEKDTLTSLFNRGLLALQPPEFHTVVLLSYSMWNNNLSTIGALGLVWVNVSAFK